MDYIYQSKFDNINYTEEYLEEIYFNLLVEEKRIIIKPNYGYMKYQKDINEQMRAILVDWIIGVHLVFNLNQETLFLTIWIIDTYLSYEIIPRTKLQLLGIASLLISCKYNEVLYPEIINFINATDKAYDVSELFQMEKKILIKLDFNILVPTSNQFYDILSKLFNFDNNQYFLGKFFLESYLIDYNMISFSTSNIALSVAYIVMKFFNIKGYKLLFNINNKNYIYQENLIKKVAKHLCFLVNNLNKTELTSVKTKYSLDKFGNVAQICQ